MLEATPDTYGWTKERVLRVLLDPQFGLVGGRSLNQVADVAQAAYGWVHRIWEDLVSVGAFEPYPRGATLKDPAKAFAYWQKHRPPKFHADYHVVGGLAFLKGIVHDRDLEYAATTYLAENLVQGHLFPRRFDLYIRASQQGAWHRELSKRGLPIDSKQEDRGIIRLITGDVQVVEEVAPIPDRIVRAETRGDWNNPVRDIWVVRPPLLIVDLLGEGGAAAAAAAMLMEKTYAKATIHRT